MINKMEWVLKNGLMDRGMKVSTKTVLKQEKVY